MNKTLVIVAGETSGDLHGSSLAKAIKKLDGGINLVGLGGCRMKEAGVDILWDLTRHATVGFTEVFGNLTRYAVAYRRLVGYINQNKPSAAVLIDLPDFNLRLASHLHQSGIPVIYYISPQVWAWRAGRVNKIKKLVQKMLVVFDFEEKIYRKAGVDVTFVGHPLLDVIDPKTVVKNGLEIGLLPASRKEQFKRLFPVITKTAELIRDRLPLAHFTIALAPGINPAATKDCGIAVKQGESHDVMRRSKLIITASGTATVEALIFETPMIVIYKLSPFTAMAARRFTKLKNFSMVNILADREVVPEFFQDQARPELISKCAIQLIEGDGLEEMKDELRKLKPRLGAPGASQRAAVEILKFL